MIRTLQDSIPWQAWTKAQAIALVPWDNNAQYQEVQKYLRSKKLLYDVENGYFKTPMPILQEGEVLF